MKHKIHNFQKIIAICFAFCSLIQCQNYLWPVKAEKALTAVFAEERPGRYHTGIDIRTFGEIGYPLQAIENGYVSRIQTSSKKYGKTLYLTLEDGNTVVYAHLDHFTPEIDNLVSALHQYYGKFSIDHYLKKNEYKFTKGDLIGYSGDTGGVSGPHLHFEIRDKNQQPLNPFNVGLSIPDNIPPVINSMAIIPLHKNSKINGISEEQIFKVKKINETEFIIIDTINVQGSIGLAVNAFDKITNQEFNFGIYGIEVYQDEEIVYSMKYDNMKWIDSKELYTEKNYSLARKGKGKYYHLFTRHGNESLSFINDNSKNKLMINENTFSNISIKIFDHAGNTSFLKLVLHNGLVKKNNNYSISFNKNNCLIKFDSKEKINPIFHLNNKLDKHYRKHVNHITLEHNLFKIENINYPTNIIEISTISKSGLKSMPTFSMENNNHEKTIGKISLKHYEHGIFIIFEEKIPSTKEMTLILKQNDQLHSHAMERKSAFQHYSQIFSPNDLKNVSEISVHSNAINMTEIFKTNLHGKIVYPDSMFNFSLLDNELIIKGDKNTFHDTTFIWANLIDVPQPKIGTLIGKAYQIQPRLIPYEKEIQLEINISKDYFPNHASIYYYNEKKNTWHYMPSSFNADSTHLITKILSGEIFAIINETQPPKFSNLIPEINGTYFASDVKHISFTIEDQFSGIDAEEDIIIELDGKRVIFEYNSYQKKIRYPLKYRLNVGKHKLYIKAKDRVGNISIKQGNFIIK